MEQIRDAMVMPQVGSVAWKREKYNLGRATCFCGSISMFPKSLDLTLIQCLIISSARSLRSPPGTLRLKRPE